MKNTKFQQPTAKQIKAADKMIEIGFQFKDYKGEPYFLPLEGGGYVMNFKCERTKAEFEAELRRLS